jgi:hypothetical protein
MLGKLTLGKSAKVLRIAGPYDRSNPHKSRRHAVAPFLEAKKTRCACGKMVGAEQASNQEDGG